MLMMIKKFLNSFFQIESKKTVLLISEEAKILKQNSHTECEKCIAIHECGHALMAYHLKIGSIYLTKDKMSYQTATTIGPDITKKLILIHYASAISEELIYGSISFGNIGSKDADFSKAVELIKLYIVMTDTTVSKSMLDLEISEKVIQLSKIFYQEGKEILETYINVIPILANELLEKEKLDLEEIEKIVNSVFADHKKTLAAV